MSYVDGFVVPIPKNKLDAYKKLAEQSCQIWLEYGALEYVECLANDVPDGEVTSFPMSVKLKEDELICFAYIRYESRAHRDEVMKKVMEDPRLAWEENLPFDGQRLIWGGFEEFIRGEQADIQQSSGP